jgi:hypothetical protein
MAVKGLTVEEGCPAMDAKPPLGVGQAVEPGRQKTFVELSPLALYPVASDGGIVRGGGVLYEHVPPYGRPGELQEVASRALVSEHPPVGPFGVELPQYSERHQRHPSRP